MSALPIDPTVLVLYDHLLDNLRGADETGRGVLVRAARVFSVLCVESAAALRSRPCFAYVLAFVLNAYRIGPSSRVCDRLPERFALHAPHAPPAPVPKPATLISAALAQRAARASDLATAALEGRLHSEPEHGGCYGSALSDDLATHVPRVVCLFVRFVRQQHAQFKAHPKYSHHFGTCARAGCARPASCHAPEGTVGGTEDATGGATGGVPPAPSSAPWYAGQSVEYWQMCCATQRFAWMPGSLRFCSDACYRAVSDEFERNVALPSAALEPPPRPRRRHAKTETTPARLYRAAIERNGAISRWIRARSEWTARHYPDTYALRDIHGTMVDMLNVDTAVLYAATIMDELPVRRRKHGLPTKVAWRRHGASTCSSAIYGARAIYKRHCQTSTPPVLARGTERWLSKVRDAALTLF